MLRDFGRIMRFNKFGFLYNDLDATVINLLASYNTVNWVRYQYTGNQANTWYTVYTYTDLTPAHYLLIYTGFGTTNSYMLGNKNVAAGYSEFQNKSELIAGNFVSFAAVHENDTLDVMFQPSVNNQQITIDVTLIKLINL